MQQRTASAAGGLPPRRDNGQCEADQLPPSWTQLFEMCRDNPYGQFHQLPFRDGEPVLEPRPKLVLTVKLGKDDGPPRSLAEIAGHKHSVRLRQQLRRWRNGTLPRLTVCDGIPDVVDIQPAD